MCNTCDQGICTGRCAAGLRTSGSHAQKFTQLWLDAEKALKALRENVKTFEDYQELETLLERQTEAHSAYILTVTEPCGSLLFVNEQHEAKAQQNKARIWFDLAAAQAVAQMIDAQVEVV